jgi:thiamine biosynthesis lipoprotein
MGTQFEIMLPRRLRSHLEAVHFSLDEVRRLEGLMTVFEAESRISEVNREAAESPVTVERELIELFELSLKVWEQTGGAFDITAGALWNMWGFHDREERVPSTQEVEVTLESVGSQYIELEPTRRTVSFLRNGLTANFGGIGKGFALDKAAKMLQNSGLAEALLHGGHSSIYAFGDPAGSGRGWQVTIRHPLKPELNFAAVWLNSIGMATSGAGERHFLSQGKRYGHVIDPRCGRPVEHHLSATALAPTAALSDALSTAFFIMSLDEVKAFCSKHPDFGAIIVPAVEEGDPPVYRFGIATSCVDPLF